jgi:hypothetical protein
MSTQGRGTTNGGADSLLDWEKGSTQSLHWEGGNDGTYAMPGILFMKLYLSPCGAGVGDYWCQLHNFHTHTDLGTDYPKMFCPTSRALHCGVGHTVKQYNKDLK